MYYKFVNNLLTTRKYTLKLLFIIITKIFSKYNNSFINKFYKRKITNESLINYSFLGSGLIF